MLHATCEILDRRNASREAQKILGVRIEKPSAHMYKSEEQVDSEFMEKRYARIQPRRNPNRRQAAIFEEEITLIHVLNKSSVREGIP